MFLSTINKLQFLQKLYYLTHLNKTFGLLVQAGKPEEREARVEEREERMESDNSLAAVSQENQNTSRNKHGRNRDEQEGGAGRKSGQSGNEESGDKQYYSNSKDSNGARQTYGTRNGYDSPDGSYHEDYGNDDEEDDDQLQEQLTQTRKRKKSMAKTTTLKDKKKGTKTPKIPKVRQIRVGTPSSKNRRPGTSE